MKWAFSLLLLANIALLMWGSWYLDSGPGEARPARAPVRAEQIRLLSEPGAELILRGTPARSPPRVVRATGCYRVGPFGDAKTAERTRARLAVVEMTVRAHEETERTVTGYRVFLPPFPSREAAERKRRELTRLGFKDHALLNEEGMRNAISLGLYTVEANARNHLRELEEKKISARIEAQYHTRTVHWLDVRAAPRDVTPEQLKKLVGNVPGAWIESYECEKPAASAKP